MVCKCKATYGPHVFDHLSYLNAGVNREADKFCATHVSLACDG